METKGLQAFRSLQKSTLFNGTQKPNKASEELSGEEQKMISKKFTGNNTPLNLYEGSGNIRQENPAARGSNIDITV